MVSACTTRPVTEITIGKTKIEKSYSVKVTIGKSNKSLQKDSKKLQVTLQLIVVYKSKTEKVYFILATMKQQRNVKSL